MATFFGLVFAVFLVLSYPLASAAILVGIAVTALSARRYLANRSANRTHTLRIPGVGAVEYRITGQ